MKSDPILIVDDNAVNLKLVKILLATEGYQHIETATTAEEALKILDTFKPRLILMDIQLPGMDGIELTRTLKSDPKFKDVIILAITAYAMQGDKERILAAGCGGYKKKPIYIRSLPDIIEGYLKNE